jgi:hypothetical protein
MEDKTKSDKGALGESRPDNPQARPGLLPDWGCTTDIQNIFGWLFTVSASDTGLIVEAPIAAPALHATAARPGLVSEEQIA